MPRQAAAKSKAAAALLALVATAASASDYDCYVLNEKDGLAAHSIEKLAAETASVTRGTVWTLQVHRMRDPNTDGFQLAISVAGTPQATETGTGDHEYPVTLSPGDSVSATLTSLGSADYDLVLLDGAAAWFAQSTSKSGADSVSGVHANGPVSWKCFVDRWWDPNSDGFTLDIRVGGILVRSEAGTGDNTYGFSVGPGELVEVSLGSVNGDPPAAPSGLTATPASHEQVDLSWNDATDPTGVIEYRVWRDGILLGSTTATAFTETGLDEGASYTYEVSVINGASLEGARASLGVTTLADTTAPVLLRARADTATQAAVVFSEPVEEATATDAGNYLLDTAAAVSAASLFEDRRTVTLATSTLSEGLTYTLTVSGVTDCSAAGNVIAPGSEVSFVYVPGLVCHLKFDEMAGSTAFDSSGSGHDGTLLNFDGPTWVAGVSGGAVDLDGADDYVELAGYKGVTGTGARTVSAWIRTTGLGPVVSWGQNATSRKWTFRVQESNGTAGAIRIEASGGYLVGEADLRDDAWHHVAVVFEDDGTPDVTDCLLYVDGALQGTSASGSVSVDTAAGADVRVGLDHAGRWFPGLIDDLRIYARALSTGEIATLHAGDATPPAPPAGLTAHAWGPGRIDLEWQPGAETDIAGYKVYRDAADDFTPTDANLAAVVVGTSSYSDTMGLAASTTYYYRVAVLDRSGNESTPSEVAAATTTSGAGSSGCHARAAPRDHGAAFWAFVVLACALARQVTTRAARETC